MTMIDYPACYKIQLIAPILGDELATALRSLGKGKSPCLKEKGALTDSQHKAVITPIPKMAR